MSAGLSRVFLAVLLSGTALWAQAAAEDANPASISLGQTGLSVTAPAAWERKQPSSRIVEHEFAVSPAAGDELPGRMTVMGAGGSVEANIDRWAGQFAQPDGSHTKPKVDERTIAGQKVAIVDISGTYKDSPGPFSGKPAVDRPDFRMLAAVISTEGGNYFLKFYGPQKTVTANEKAFQQMLETLLKK